MSILFIVACFFFVTLLGIVLWIISTYNHLVNLKGLLNEGWSGIDIQLKRRSDLIPNLVAVVKNYASHERNVFENIANMRAQSMGATNIADRAIVENNITQALKTVFALAENYPDLKANANFLSLQKDMGTVEHELQLARRYYNGAARNYNISIAQFPTRIVANISQFASAPYFETIAPHERENPKILE